LPSYFTKDLYSSAPTATLSYNGAVNAGSAVNVSFSNPFDPSAADIAAGFHYSFATTAAGLASSYAAAGTASSASVTFDDTGNNTVYGRIFDKDNGFTDYQTTIVVKPTAAVAFRLAAPTGSAAGSAFTITVTAVDGFGNTVPGYLGTVHFTSSDARATLPADYTFQSSDGGTYTFANGVTLVTAGSQSVTVSAAGMSSATGVVTVSPAAAASLSFTAPAAVTAGTAVTVTITALDAYGNVATGYSGAVHFASSDGLAALPADYTFGAADQGIHSFSVTLRTAGSQALTATDTATGSIAATQTGILVSPAAAATVVVAGFPLATTAGAAHTVTVTMRDAYGNVATGYTGTVHFTSSDGQASLPGDYTFIAADAGVHTFTATLKTAGSQSLAVTDTSTASLTGSEAGISVVASVATHFSIKAPANVTSGVAFSIIVTALDAYGNVATGYRGRVHFTSSDHKGILPADYTFLSSDSGVHTSTVTLRSTGSQSITATDTANSSIKGTTNVNVLHG
jgi:hypothetical protein